MNCDNGGSHVTGKLDDWDELFDGDKRLFGP